MSDFVKPYEQLAIDCINKGYETEEAAMSHLVGLSPNLQNDVVFQYLFPNIFAIAMCKCRKNAT